MKLYIIITPFFPTESSFRGPFIYDQVKAIQKTGKYDVIVFKPKKINDKRNFYIYDGIKIYLFPTFQMPSLFFEGFCNNINAKMFIFSIKETVNINNIEIAHGHTASSAPYILALKKENKKITTILQHHDKDPYKILYGKFAGWKYNLQYRAKKNICLFNKIDIHVSISHIVEDNLLSFPYPGKTESYAPYINRLIKLRKSKLSNVYIKNSIVLYNGVDKQKFYKSNNHKDKTYFTIGCIGNFTDIKDQLTLIKAMKIITNNNIIKNCRLYFVGSGTTLPICKKYVTTYNLSKNTYFIQEMDHKYLVDFYNKLDIFVLPSCFEGFGCVYAESYFCGVPFMACYNEGAAECICKEDANQWLIYPHDYKQLADNIEYYYKNRDIQKLNTNLDINVLISSFLNTLKA